MALSHIIIISMVQRAFTNKKKEDGAPVNTWHESSQKKYEMPKGT